MSRIYNAFDSAAAHQPTYQTSILSQQSEKLDDIKTASDLTNTKIDGLSGAINNNLGDASTRLQTYLYGYDSPNGLARPLAVTSNGELKVSNDVLEVSAETVNLNTDTLETKIQSLTNSLTGDGAGGDNAPGVILKAINDNVITNNSSSGNIEAAVQLMDDVVVAQNAAHPSKANAVGGRYYVDNSFRDIRVDNVGKVIIDTPQNSDLHNAVTHHLTQNGDGTGNKAGVILDAINTNTITQNNNQTNGNQITKIMGSEDATTSGTQRQIHVDGNGNIQTNVVNTLNIQPSNSSNSHITDDPANSVAVGLKGRTTIGTATTEIFLLADSDGKQIVKKNDNITNGSEVVYVSGQSISGSGTFEGSAIAVNANTRAFYVEHNFSHTGIKYEILASIDGSNFFSTGVEFNNSGMTPATLTGLNTINGVTTVTGFSPHIKFKFTNSDSSAQTATLSYVQQIG